MAASRKTSRKHSMKPALLALLLTLCAGPSAVAGGKEAQAASGEPLVVFLVRHAEKMLQSRDPALSPAGLDRARVLATSLADAGISHIHSSDYLRTRSTAAPIAADTGLEIELYDPAKLETLAQALRAAGGRHLVVGHSDTTPAMVKLLTGESPNAIDESREYDRLYVVTVDDRGTGRSLLLRYGRAYSGGTPGKL